MIVYRSSDADAATTAAPSRNGTSLSSVRAGRSGEVETVTLTPATPAKSLNRTDASGSDNGRARDLKAHSPRKRTPAKTNPRKLRWNKRHFAFQQGKLRTSGWRLLSQGFFTLLCVVLGWQFIRFVDAAYTTTSGPLPLRPPGVEGFLPISGLMGALDWINYGSLNPIHPAATILFLLFAVLAFVFRKSFCGWICPVGLVSESLARFGKWLFGKNLKVPAWLDFILRGIKYFLLGFFLWAIFTMGAEALHAFIMSPYNKVSDIKMLEFFRHLSKTSAIVILVLAAGSVLINGLWCRYMCPYGAMMGIFGWFSPMKIRRDESKCTDCKLCDKACPAKLIISERKSITKVECIGCTDCVTTCPVPGALYNGTKKRSIQPRTIAIAIVVALVVVTSGARIFGVWQNELSADEIRFHVERMDSDAYGHPGR